MFEILVFLIGYIIGSVPFAYIYVKKANKIDITENGSGNVGAYNSFLVTKSFLLAFLVFASDFIKGAIGIIILKYFFEANYLIFSIYTIGALVGHCFSIFIKFKGGRGLATVLGSTIFYNPAIPIIWSFIWVISYIYKREIHFANISATLLLLAFGITNAEVMGNNYFSNPIETNLMLISITTLVISLIILFKHKNTIKFGLKKNKMEE